MEPNTFAGAGLDRAGERREDEAWIAARVADPEARAVLASSRGVALRDGRPALVPLAEVGALAGAGEPLLLGLDEGRPLLAVDVEGIEPGRFELTNLREAGGLLAQADGGLVAYAAALLNWHRRHGHCAVCGSPTAVVQGGLLRVCPACGAHHHPRTDPVVIVLVTDGDRALLGRQPSWPPRRYSALAGFVEPAETLEEAVAREVLEEAGVQVRDARYVSSQPWPFPASLMLGFLAGYAGGEVSARDAELEDVRWFDREELRAACEDDDAGPLLLPPRLAIARRLIEGWLAG